MGVGNLQIDLPETCQPAGERFLSENECGYRDVVVECQFGARSQADHNIAVIAYGSNRLLKNHLDGKG